MNTHKFVHRLLLSAASCLAMTQALADNTAIANKYIVVFNEEKFTSSDHKLTDAAEDTEQATSRLMKDVEKHQAALDKNKPKAALAKITNKTRFIYQHAIKGFAAELTPEALEKLKQDPLVAYVEPDYPVKAIGFQSPAPSWGLDRIDQTNLPLDSVYQYSFDGSQAHVYVIDSGIRLTHSEFTGRIGTGVDLIDNDTTPNDCLGHGTHVSGTIAGTTYGVAKNAIIHPVKIFGCTNSADTSTVIAAIDWVRVNHLSPAVANMSIGGGLSQAENTAVQNLVASGVAVAVAAGNDNVDACQQSPASAPEAITVAASTATDARANFSNKGNCVDIFAPGENIVSSTLTTDTSSAAWNGTSMATPHVAGVLAQFRGRYPTASMDEATSAVLNSALVGKITDAQSTNNRLLSVNVTASACFLSGKSGQLVRRTNGAGYVAAAQYAASYCGACGYRMNTYDNVSYEFFCK